MGFADTVAEHKSGPRTVVAKQLAEWLEAKPRRESKNYNVSSIYGKCPRATVLEALIPKPDDWDAQATLRTDAGSALHWWYQNKYLGPMGILFGIWECTACGFRTMDDMPMPQDTCKCSGPKSKRWEFVETRVEYAVPGLDGVLLTGYYDGKIRVEMGNFLWDMKFPGPKSFARAKSARESYIRQIQLYMAIEEWDGMGLLFTGDKNDGSPEAVEHIVHPNPDVLEEEAQKIREIEAAKAMLRAWGDGSGEIVLPCRLCQSEREGMYVRWCGWGQECFNDVLMDDVLKRVPE
jgi:hypothetical protein